MHRVRLGQGPGGIEALRADDDEPTGRRTVPTLEERTGGEENTLVLQSVLMGKMLLYQLGGRALARDRRADNDEQRIAEMDPLSLPRRIPPRDLVLLLR